ncbi:MAG: hypothetical protein KAX26_01935, partial [Anaerolineae bacterium]|nr:hypothetical protein [Anaerolineae bacterium]
GARLLTTCLHVARSCRHSITSDVLRQALFSAHAQLDVVGLNRGKRRVVFGEARWRRQPATVQTLERLMERSRAWLGQDPDWEVHYALFARAFGQELRDLAAAEGDVHLYAPENMLTTC